jgi:hypothetical protein
MIVEPDPGLGSPPSAHTLDGRPRSSRPDLNPLVQRALRVTRRGYARLAPGRDEAAPGEHALLGGQAASIAIEERLRRSEPAMIARCGDGELRCLADYVAINRDVALVRIRGPRHWREGSSWSCTPSRPASGRSHARRRDLFDDPRVLPEFELKTSAAVQSIAGNDTGFETGSMPWSRCANG